MDRKKSTFKLLMAAAVVGIVSLAALPAQALPFLNGSVAVNGTTETGALQPPANFVTTANTVQLSDGDGDGDGDLFAGARSGDFATILSVNDEINVSTQIMDLQALGTKVFDFSELAFPTNGIKFTATTFTRSVSQNGPNSYILNISGLGFWTDANGVWASTLGGYSLSLTQTTFSGDPNAAVSFSGTLAAAGRTPEPGILALMGLGLAGLAFLRRRRNSEV